MATYAFGGLILTPVTFTIAYHFNGFMERRVRAKHEKRFPKRNSRGNDYDYVVGVHRI